MAWWRGKPLSNAATFSVATCAEDPQGALALLQEEQGRVAQELEDTFRAYDIKLREIASRLAQMGDRAVSAKELERLHGEQQELWRLIRRAQASARATHELEQELCEWSARDAAAIPPGHPDHPGTRAEFAASELRLRGKNPEELLENVRLQKEEQEVPGPWSVVHESNDKPQAADRSLSSVSGPVWHSGTDESLLREIHARELEMRKHWARADDAQSAAELALFLRELRELHAHLRLHDRRTEQRRERWRLGIPAT